MNSVQSSNARILDFLAQGIAPIQVLSIVGCSPQYMNSLLKNEEFMKEVEEARKPYLVHANEDEIVTNKYLSLEHKILKQIENQVESADLKDAIRALEVVSNRQEKRMTRKAMPTGESRVTNVINLVLPSHAIPEYTMNSTKEVIAIDDKLMAPMTSEGVKGLFKDMQENIKTVVSI